MLVKNYGTISSGMVFIITFMNINLMAKTLPTYKQVCTHSNLLQDLQKS